MSETLKTRIREILKGISEDECDTDDGWWETSTGVEFGTERLRLGMEAIDETMNQSPWKSIDSAPKDGSHIQLYRPEIQFVGYYSKVGWIVNAPGLPPMIPEPTHWQTLPASPKEA